MNDGVQRDLSFSTNRLVPREFLQALFTAELIFPSRRFWICSPWVTDLPLLDNSSRQLSGIEPTWPASNVKLTVVIEALVSRGARVAVIVNNSRHNDTFRQSVAPIQRRFPQLFNFVVGDVLHEKGLHGDNFTLDGSMNFTFGGVFVNEEHLVYRTNREAVSRRLLDLDVRWRDELSQS